MSYTIVMILLGAVALLCAVLTVHSWRLRPAAGPMASAMALLLAGLTWWIAGYMLELSATSIEWLAFFNQSKYLGIVVVPIAWVTFTLYYTGRDALLTRRGLALLLINPILTTLIIWTNDAHQLMWAERGSAVENGFFVFTTRYGPYFWLHSAYAYITLLGAVFLMLRQFGASPRLYRRQISVAFIAVTAPLVANAITIFGNFFLDLTPLAFAVSGFAFFWGLLRYQLLDITPIARNVVIDNMTDGMIILDTHDRIVDLNPAARRLVRWVSSDVIGQPIARVVRLLSEQPELLNIYRQMTPTQGEISAQREGQPVHMDVRVSPLHDSHQRLTGRVVVFRDITERKQSEQRIQAQNEALAKANEELGEARKHAEQATQLKSHFLATMSHELRTPLAAIIGYTEIQLAGMTGPLTDEQREQQERVLANADHLLGLINDVLDLSKIEAGRMDLIQQPFVVKDWLSEIIDQNRVLAEEKALKLEVEIGADLPQKVIGDAERLKQVVINLLSNAVKFTESGTVRVELGRGDAGRWRIAVSDTGIGIPPHAQETIFDEFRQVDSSTRRQHGGTGLGLAIARKLVLMMGGSIRLKSEVGQGSTFTVTLPLVTEPEPAPELFG